MSNPTIFEIYEIEGERWANLISFGIRVKDTHKDADFDNLGLGLSFNTTEFEYVPGTFDAGSRTLEAMATAADYLNDDHADDGGLSFAFVADSSENADGTDVDSPINYSAGTYEENGETKDHDPYIAKFMLKRVDDTSGINKMSHFGNYTELTVENGAVVENVVNPTQTTEEDFDFGPDSLTINIKTPASSPTAAPNVELFVSNGTVADGLSIVPIQKMGDLVQFQVMMNVSYPTTLLPSLEHVVNATINISADEIFTESIYSRADDADILGSVAATAEYDLGGGDGLESASLVAELANAANALLPDEATNFMQKLELISDQEVPDFDALETATDVAIKFTSIGAGGVQITDDGKYVLAEFWARNSAEGVTYTFTDDDESDNPLTAVDEAAEPEENITIKSGMIPNGEWTGTVKDGSDVTLLGDSFYINPFSELRSITSNDASTALKMAVADPDAGVYDEADFIAADFNRDGEVTAGDAFDILQTAAYIDPDDQESYPTWFYVRDLDTSDSTAKVELGDQGTTVDFDQHLDLFIGTDTTINATAVLTGDTDHDFRLLDNKANPVYDYFSGLIGTFVSPTQVTAGGGGGGNPGGGGTTTPPTLTLTTASFGVASTNKADAVGAPNAEHLVTSTDEHDVTAAIEGETGLGDGTSMAKITDGMMSIVAGADKIDTWQEAAKAAEIVAGAVNPTNNTDHVVVGWFDGTDTIVIEVDDATTEGTFVAKKATKVTGEATALNTQDNAAGTIYIDTSPQDAGSNGDTGGAGGTEPAALPYYNLNQTEAGQHAPPISSYLSTAQQSGGMFAIATKVDGTGEAIPLEGSDAAGFTPVADVMPIALTAEMVTAITTNLVEIGTITPPEGSETPPPEGSETPPPEGSETPPPEGSETPPPEGSETPPPEGGGGMDGVVDVTTGQPGVATADPEVFKLPASSGTAEIVKFESGQLADGDVVEGFVPAEDTIEISAPVTSLTDLGEVNANTESEAMGMVGATFQGASYASPAGGLALVTIVDVDTATAGDQGGQMLVIDSTGAKTPDFMIMFAENTFANAAEAVGAVDLIA